MTVVAVALLGRPKVLLDGVPVDPPRGNKAWALLAHLALSDRPVPRRTLVDLLFAEAQDPPGALRWNISELRRVLRAAASLDGDPLCLQLAPGSSVDVRQLTDGGCAQAVELAGFGRELLEGLSLPTAPGFDAWLSAERCRIRSCAEAVLVECALDQLARGSAGTAAQLAARAVAMDPLDPGHHAILVRSLGAAGDHVGARRQAVRCVRLFRRELGCAPPAEILAATRPPCSGQLPVAGVAAVRSYLDAGQASMRAGAVDRGLDQLQRAADVAVGVGAPALRAGAFLALASARVHGAGERGTEVRSLLHAAAALARTAQAEGLVAAACRELGFLGVQRGQHDRALVWLDEAQRATDEDGETARTLGVRGMCLTDGGEYDGALRCLDESVGRAVRAGDTRQQAWSLAMVGRIHTLRAEHALAVPVLDTALQLVSQDAWTAFQPWPEAFRAEAAIGLGDRGTARDLLDHAWVLATESDDHCWMATVAHGQARLALVEGDRPRAQRWCDRGLAPAPWYLWPYARLLEAACAAAPDAGRAALARIDRLTAIAARGSMRPLLARAHLHRAQAGARNGVAAARAVASQLDDPALHALITRHEAMAAARHRARPTVPVAP
ncbi:DNA-binding transcriptional activator of the SARP family [Blastococcus sp. DSM 46786]|uniref:BTAD domain-containing putative transcriptional regulator n=1 Tax=Blastococcus sp. DSM 46786 TaxID=1798227 RepID=UPI0008C76856|nr:BTAD domain-containing putative transcriptional regulator [Blastococcus sp. DSM 46786]SEM13128.1 DNA-binding transcriptional activator of the SARP family [Blastococcus sp. DSM 46786]